MKQYLKKIIVWSLILSLVLSVGTFSGGMTTAKASEMEEDEPSTKREQHITVEWDSVEVDENVPVKMSYGQEIFLDLATDGDGSLSYAIEQESEVIEASASEEMETGKEADGEKTGIALKAIGVGSASLIITAGETEECQKAEKEIKVEVSKAEYDIAVSDMEKQFSTEPFSLDLETDIIREEGVKLSYTSSNTAVAEVHEDGMVEMKGLGKTTITVTVPETEHYAEMTQKFVLTIVTSLPIPTIKSVANQNGSIKLVWNVVADAEGYLIYRKVGSDAWEQVAELSGGKTKNYIDTDVIAGKKYQYKIKAYRSSMADVSGYSETATIRYLLPPAFRLALVMAGNKISWEATDGTTSYYIYRKENPSESWTKVKKVASTSTFSWTDTKVENGKTYYYTIRAYEDTSKSATAPEQSFFYLQGPSIKKFSRKSATKMVVQWNKNPEATGYQIQYAKNRFFVGGKTVQVKKNATVSKTLTKLTKNKAYYVRIRAYKTTSGTTTHSAWSLHKNVKTNKTASISLLKKKKKTFELREYAKQTMYNYDTVQGGCTDGTYGYFTMYNRKVNKCRIVKVKLSNLKVAKVSPVLELEHGNDMAYNPDLKEIVILHSGPNYKRVSIVNPKTLKIKSTKDIDTPAVLNGASGKRLEAIKGYTAIAYNPDRKQYALKLKGNANLLLCDVNLNPVSYVKISRTTNRTYQGMDATGDYILIGQSPGKLAGNIVSVYTWNGEFVSDITVKKGYELENIFHAGNQFYAGFYRSYYKIYYTKEKKMVKVNGKKKRVTVKVRHKELMRDNYIYKIGNI